MKNNLEILVVGAGFSGSVIARQLAEAGMNVVVIDARCHIAGNAYDTEERGIRYHVYGPHLFHTNNRKVFDYLSKFTEWIDYRHEVKAVLDDGNFVVLPPNMETAQIVGEENLLDVFYRPYTRKMWGMEIEELDKNILNRVKVRADNNTLYFPDDHYQALPKAGYTAMVKNILDHPNITVHLETKFEKLMEHDFDHCFLSMAIDEYYDYKFGELPYRSIKFHHTWLKTPRVNKYPTVNLTNNSEYTRYTEWQNFPGHGQNVIETLVTWEEPCDYRDNNLERYYPVKDINGQNANIYKKYKDIMNPNVTFIGRCGLYTYLDMHQAINSALVISQKYLSKVMDY